jgi:hypothetical protein
MKRSLLLSLALLLAACGRSSSTTGSSTEPAQHAPPGDPATLPKVTATQNQIAALIRERYGDPIARNLFINVEDQNGGKRVSLSGEVPNEEIRQALIKELETRITDMKSEDFTLQTAGPIPQVFAFPAGFRADDLVAFSPDLSLTVAENGSLYETATGRFLNRIALPGQRIFAFAFSPDGKTLAVGTQNAGLFLFDMPAGKLAKTLSPIDMIHSGDTVAVQFTADGKQLFSINTAFGELILWNPATGASKTIGTQYPKDGAQRFLDRALMAVAPAGNFVAVCGGSEHKVLLWDVAARSRKSLDAQNVSPEGFAFSHDGKTFFAARGVDEPRGVVTFDIPSGKAALLSLERDDLIRGIALSADDHTLAVNYIDHGIVLWDLPSRKQWLALDPQKAAGPSGFAFSPDGTLLATACSSTQPPLIRLWNVSKRPGNSAQLHLPPLVNLPNVIRDDYFVANLERSIRGRFPPQEIESLHLDLQPDFSITLAGRVANTDVKRIAQEIIENYPLPEEFPLHTQIKVTNNLQPLHTP